MYSEGGVLLRHVDASYQAQLAHLERSGLYQALVSDRLLVPHEVVSHLPGLEAVLRPEFIPTITYPYEWCFSQLKDAALCTLSVLTKALDHGMILKDASAFNIQFQDGRPIFIDTLSFDFIKDGEPWNAYRQFCQHFLAPLALIADRNVSAQTWMRDHIDGIPLEVASKLLSWRTHWKLGLKLHIHANAHFQPGEGNAKTRPKVSLAGLKGLVESLRSTVESLQWNPPGTTWGDYYAHTNYADESMNAKRDLVLRFVMATTPRVVWDLGANTGEFSEIAAETGAEVIAWDIDPLAVEKHYRKRKQAPATVLPVLQDFSNPSPSIGWNGLERSSFFDRANADTVLALALVHHLAIGNNVPLDMVAMFLRRLGSNLIIEFVPKEDSQVQRMLSTREDIFDDYTLEGFRSSFGQFFTFEEEELISGSCRTLFRMKGRAS